MSTEFDVVDAVETNAAHDAILDAFNVSVEQNLGETDTKLAMIKAGADFKNVTRLYNKFMIDAGLAISKEDRNKIIEETLTGLVLDNEEDFNNAVEDIISAIDGTTERGAQSLIRAYAKKNGLAVWVKPKAESTGTPRPGFTNGYHNWLIANVPTTKEQATAYVMGTDGHASTSQNVQNHLSVFLSHWDLVDRAYKAAKA